MDIKLKMPEKELFAAQVDLLRRSIVRELALAHMAGMIVVALVLWNEVSWHLMAGWCVTQLLVLLVREATINKLTLVPEAIRQPRRDYKKILAGNITTGLLWALGMCHVAAVASVQTQYICLMVIICISAVAMGVGAIMRSYYVSFVLAALSPVAFWYLGHFQGTEFNLVVGALILLSSTVMIHGSATVHKSYRNIIIANWQNGSMADRLTSMTSSLRDKNSELNRSRQHLAQLASIDELTLLHNRKHFNSALKTEWRRALRFSSPLSCIIIEIDCFEQYQQNYGEEQANVCLQRLALCFKEVVTRAGDMVARYDDAQFAVLLPNTSMGDAEQVCKRVISRLKSENIEHESSSVAQVVTVSQGLASCLPGANSGGDPSRLAICAEQAMQQVKATGQNSYRTYEGEMSDLTSLVSS